MKIQYNRNRYYDYHTGRWLTHDPLGITPNAQKPNVFGISVQYKDGLSLYEYGRSNPINLQDPFGLMTDWDIFWEFLDHWVTGGGAPFIRTGGKWEDYFTHYPGFRGKASVLLKEEARKICQSSRQKGSYLTPRVQMLINRSYPIIVTLNGVRYQISGTYTMDKCRRIKMKVNKHVVTDIADPAKWYADFLIYGLAVFGEIMPSDTFKFFYFEANWVEHEYVFQMECEECKIKNVKGDWSF